MIRHLITSICLLLVMLPMAKAAPIEGIRVESSRRQIVVFIDGQQVCSPTNSCFVANLRGSYRVEVYAASSYRGSLREGDLLYDERVFCRINEVMDIFLEEGYRPGGGRTDNYESVMSPNAFSRFIDLMKKQTFDSDRKEVLEHALQTSRFTTDQCIRLLELYSFDSEKKELLKLMYPKIVDKPNFYYAIDKLTFSLDKNEINNFIKEYHERNN